jgi:hypothetical protein
MPPVTWQKKMRRPTNGRWSNRLWGGATYEFTPLALFLNPPKVLAGYAIGYATLTMNHHASP